MIRRLYRLYPGLLLALAAPALAIAVVSACSSEDPIVPANVDGGVGPVEGPTLSVAPADCQAGFVLAPGERTMLTITVKDPAGAPANGQEILFLAPDGPGMASGTFEPAEAPGARYGRAKAGADGVASITFVAADNGTFLIDALPIGAQGGATFAITVNADGARPGASLKDARCRFENELLAPNADARAKQLLHGPVFVPAGTKVRPAGVNDKAVDIAAASLVFWVDEKRSTKFEHATRFVILDAQNAAAAPNVVEATSWPELVLPGAAPVSLIPPVWTTVATSARAEALTTASVDPNRLETRADTAVPVAGAPGEKACAIVLYGQQGNFLKTDAEYMRSFYVNQLHIPVFAKTDGQGHLTEPYISDLPGLLASAKAAGFTKVFLYISSHAGTSGPDHFRASAGAVLQSFDWENLRDIIKTNLGSGITLSFMMDGCYSESGTKFMQELEMDGEYLSATDIAHESGAGLTWQGLSWMGLNSIDYTSYFTDRIRACWKDPASDYDKDGRITLAEAFRCLKETGASKVTDPNPKYVQLLKDGRAFSPAVPEIDIPCPDVEVAVPINAPQDLTGDLPGTVEVGSEDIAVSTGPIFFNTNKPGDQGLAHLKGVKPGQTTYTVAVFVAPYRYKSTGVLKVGAVCADGGVDAGQDAGPTDQDSGPADQDAGPKPCTYANGTKIVEGKKIYRVPVNVGCSGDQVCAAAGLTCAGVPVLATPSAACVAFHPGTQVKSDVNGWKQSVYCNGTAGGLGCNSEVQCHDCPLCGTGLACNDPNSSLLSELYVECK